MIQIPIRRITFSTPEDERAALVKDGIDLYQSDSHSTLLSFVEKSLAAEPEQSDVVHDLLVYLAEQMIALNKQRQEKLEDFTLDLEGVLSSTELEKIERLWTPINTSKADDTESEQRQTEAQQILGSLAAQQLDLRDDIGLLNEEQWKWLIKRRLGSRISNLVDLVRVFRQRQPAIATLDRRIAATDSLIDQIVYRLYSLTPEEIAIVEGTNK